MAKVNTLMDYKVETDGKNQFLESLVAKHRQRYDDLMKRFKD